MLHQCLCVIRSKLSSLACGEMLSTWFMFPKGNQNSAFSRELRLGPHWHFSMDSSSPGGVVTGDALEHLGPSSKCPGVLHCMGHLWQVPGMNVHRYPLLWPRRHRLDGHRQTDRQIFDAYCFLHCLHLEAVQRGHLIASWPRTSPLMSRTPHEALCMYIGGLGAMFRVYCNM